MTLPNYVYVASSWRNPIQIAVCAALKSCNINHYDFRNPEGHTGFSWNDVKPPNINGHYSIPNKGSDYESMEDFCYMLKHPRAILGFESDFIAIARADTLIMILPCGKSAHLELGLAVGLGKKTAILMENPIEPELMYRMVDYMATDLGDLLGWLGVED